MAFLDWTIIALFIVALIGICIWVMKNKTGNTSDFFLSGRSETWLTVGAAIFAANIGSEHLVGLAGAGAQNGMSKWITTICFFSNMQFTIFIN